ncbi:hypothetical protein SAMN05519104_8376 [Rhizobiales bacterium GAS188]|nr:hypothetical protein SAMN05519104_8376 [Rhizobiales bacterium GAS188]
MMRFYATAIMLVLEAGAAHADTDAWRLQGTCKLLSTPTGKIECAGYAFYTEFDTASGFTFGDGQHTAVGFEGETKDITHINGDFGGALPIGLVEVTADGQKSAQIFKASGNCVYENPLQGVPATVRCYVSTPSGVYKAEFVTDGSKPTHSK